MGTELLKPAVERGVPVVETGAAKIHDPEATCSATAN